ncbi:hypothetical protein ABH966_001752 [Lysinibacillus sp. RC46]|uniref:hypothetical protein n=1 Tax=unclassified Lysinibacillus TaxID=2636778 RepID=UPI00351463FD
MLSQAKIEALLKKSPIQRLATQEEREQFFVKLEQQLPMRNELAGILNNRKRLKLFVNISNTSHYSFQLEHHEASYILSDSYFVRLD